MNETREFVQNHESRYGQFCPFYFILEVFGRKLENMQFNGTNQMVLALFGMMIFGQVNNLWPKMARVPIFGHMLFGHTLK